MTIPPRTLNRNDYLGGAAAVIQAVLVGTLVAYRQLPNLVPIHWDAQGYVNGWGPKWSVFVYGPGMTLFIVLMCSALPWVSPKTFEVDAFRDTHLYIMIAIVAMLACCQRLIVVTTLGVLLDTSRAVEGGICLLIALLGNVMGKVLETSWSRLARPGRSPTSRYGMPPTAWAPGLSSPAA